MSQLVNNNFYKEGFYLCLDNSKRLAKIAAVSAKENEFSVACSLNILSGEEAIKSIALIIKHYNPNTEFEEFNKLFTNHKTKHNFLIEASNIIAPIVEIVYTKHGFYNYLFSMMHRLIPQIPEPEVSKLMNDAKPFLDLLEKNTQITNDSINSEEAKVWWQKANDEKNKGLYVDIVNSNWRDPKSFTLEKFQESSKYTNSMIENADRIIDLLERAKKAEKK